MATEAGLSPMDYAVMLTGAHPELSTPDPTIQKQVDVYINAQTNALYNLGTAISKQGPASPTGGWATLVQVGKLETNPVYQYNLSLTTVTAAGPVIQGTLVQVKQDTSLQDKLWTLQEGVTGSYEPVVPPVTGFSWTAHNIQPQYGIAVQTVSADPQALQFQIVLHNDYPAFYSVYAEFLDASGMIITPSSWTSRLPRGTSFETATMKYIGMAPPTMEMEGMSITIGSVTMNCTAPTGTASIRLTFGSLGALGWNPVVNSLPLMFSGVLGYGVPWIMKLAGGFTSTSSEWYFRLLSNASIATELTQAAGFLASSTSTSAAIGALGEQVGKLLFGGSLPKLMSALRSEYSDSVLIQAAQGLNWPLSGLLSSLQNGIASGIVEVLSVPATFSRTYRMNQIVSSAVHVQPDPMHGAWPLAAASYEIRWTTGGVDSSSSGAMNGIWTEAVLSAEIPQAPYNAAVSAQAMIYDAAGRLIGQGNAEGVASASLQMTISEQASDMNKGYGLMLVLAFDSKTGFSWQPPSSQRDTSTVKSLTCSNVGTNLCLLTGISYNAAEATLEYGWRASGAMLTPCGGGTGNGQQMYRLQAVSISSSAQASLKPASCGFYSMTTIAAGSDSSNNIFFDTRTTPYALRDITLGDAGPFQFPSGQSRGYFTLSTVDSLVAHPAGYAAAVSASSNMLQIVQLSEQQVNDSAAPGPISVGGAGARVGLLSMPVAVAVAPTGCLIVLEAGNKRLQAFDVYGNSFNYFSSTAILPLRQQSDISYLDLAIDGEGQMYVLSYSGDGSLTSQYQLDVYSSQGTLLSTTHSFNAAKITVDEWRNVYALDYSLMQGPAGDVSPTVQVWAPLTTALVERKA